ncbi:hypothetical protein LguiA_032835 [Lonicera macranthoides]
MAIGVCTSHKIADVLSIVMLITTWAQTARGDSKIVSPQFESDKLFPPKNLSGYQTSVGMTKDKIVTKRFVFDNSTVASLRAKYSDNTSEACLLRATRVEGLSAFIWKRIDPPLPECSFGNLYRIAMSMPTMETLDECGGLGKPVRVGSVRLPFEILATFMDTRRGDRIEAWTNMEEEEMGKFEVDKESLSFVSQA